jgi:hypothetical protein
MFKGLGRVCMWACGDVRMLRSEPGLMAWRIIGSPILKMIVAGGYSHPSLSSFTGVFSPLMSLRIYNTLSREIDQFSPLVPGHVRMYVCGMTIYDFCHIGHARMMMAFDVVQRWLKASGLMTRSSADR